MNPATTDSAGASLTPLIGFARTAFERRFGQGVVVGVAATPLAHECCLTLLVHRRTPEMVAAARELEREFSEDWQRHVTLAVKQPWKSTLRGWVRRACFWRPHAV